jgi:hypothetical protein
VTATPTGRAPTSGSQPVSRWVRAAAYAVPLCVLPSALWRLWALARGLPPGCRLRMAAWEPWYITGLSVVSFAAALLTVGLVRPWGEVVPGWVPFLGGRAVLVRVAMLAAGVGAAVIFAVYAYALLNPVLHFREPADLPGCPPPTEQPGAWVAIAAYAPLLAWGPLLVVVTVAYYRRRTRAA